jgi:hypothetical protein
MADMMLYKRVPGWRSRWVWEPQKGCSDNIHTVADNQSPLFCGRGYSYSGHDRNTSADIFLFRTLFSTNLIESEFSVHISAVPATYQ